jgi:lipopolysaccharide export system permease protein
MSIFDRYIFKNTAIAALFIAAVLIAVVFLTQSLRFLELILESGASGGTFWLLALLAIPRFFEIILPLSLMAAVLFVYSRMTSDSELIVMRAVGHEPARLAKPAFLLAIITALFLLINALWIAPKAVSNMQEMRQTVKAKFSTSLFREGVFNQMGNGLMVYVRQRADDGTLLGVMIHDSREGQAAPSTIIAKRGTLILTKEGYQVLVEEGSRQDYDPKSRTLKRLNFNRYSLELPDSDPVRGRWQEPEERTLFALLNPDLALERDLESLRDFRIELNRRIVSPFFAIVFSLIACAALLIGPVDRRGQGLRIFLAVFTAIVIQALYLACYNLARHSDWGLFLMWALPIVPLIVCIFILDQDYWRSLLSRSPKNKSAA